MSVIDRCSTWIVEKMKPYYSTAIEEYTKMLGRSADRSEDNWELTWMREDLLTSQLYQCTIDGDVVPLEELLFGKQSVKTDKNIIVISGEKRIGKRCFANKLLEVCQQRSSGAKTITIGSKGSYRLPVMISQDIRTGDKDLKQLIVEEIEKKVPTKHHTQHKQLEKKVEELLAHGRFLIYFKGQEWLGVMEEDLNRILHQGRIVPSYDKRAGYHNLVVLTINAEADITQSFVNKTNSISLQLKKLTRDEVETYISQNVEKLRGIIEKDEKIMEILRYPEHLKMFETLYQKELFQEGHDQEIRNAFDFYDYFIRANIKKQLTSNIDKQFANDVKKQRINLPKRVDTIYRRLQGYALSSYVSGVKTAEKVNPSSYFQFEDYIECGLLDSSYEFIFPSCGYYLAAKQLLESLKQKTLEEIPVCLIEEPLETILFWTSEMIEDVLEFAKFWSLLLNLSSCKLLLLSKIASRSQKYSVGYMQKIYDMAVSALSEEFYDYTALEVFNEQENISGSYLKTKYLELLNSDKKEDNNTKKRIVYYLGISHQGIIPDMLEELMQEKTDKHLKYHIIRAAVENCDEQNSRQHIEKYFNDLQEYCNKEQDPIIQSDFCVLHKKYLNVDWMAPRDESGLAEELQKLLKSDEYWVRAHAAGALGRRGASNINLLLDRVKEELGIIYKKEDGYRNSIKVISYSVEAICEMAALPDNKVPEVVYELVKFLDMERLGDRDVEDAYATIATAIEYLISRDKGKLPFNLGDRFRNHVLDHQKVLINIFRELERFFDSEDEDEACELVKSKQEAMKPVVLKKQTEGENGNMKKANTIRVLHLSDLHWKGENARDNILLGKVKKLTGINVLVITGDLKQFGTDYENALKVLNDLSDSLDLTPEDVFMVPGNHDCDDYTGKKEDVEKIRTHIYDNNECYQTALGSLKQGVKAYSEFLEKFYGKDRMQQGGIENCLLTWNNQLNILTMNTALLCDKETDKDKIVDITQLSGIQKENDLPTLSISHHKLGDLYLDHADAVKSIFKDLKVSALLSGDVHRSGIEHIDLGTYAIPNYICAKFSGEPGDKWSKYGCVVYDLDPAGKHLKSRFFSMQEYELKPDLDCCKLPEALLEEKDKATNQMVIEDRVMSLL